MCADDPKTTTPDGKYHGKLCFPVDGEIEEDESIKEAAIWELHEETGITEEEVKLGPIVWYGDCELMLNDTLTHLKQTFIETKSEDLSAKTSPFKSIRMNNWHAKSINIIQ